jgi:lauroyl/myristoyl acyltransferase
LCKRFDATVFTALPQFVDDQYRITIEPFTLPTSGLSPGELTEDLQQFMNKVQSHIEEQPFLWRDLRRADLLPRLGITERT